VVRSLDFVYWLACCSLSFLLSWVFFPLFCVVPCIIPPSLWLDASGTYACCISFFFACDALPSLSSVLCSSSILATLLFFSISFPCALLCPNLQMVTTHSLRFEHPSSISLNQKTPTKTKIPIYHCGEPKIAWRLFLPLQPLLRSACMPPCLFLIRYPDRRNPFPSFIVPFDQSNLFCISPPFSVRKLCFDFSFSCHASHNPPLPSLVALLAAPQALPQIKSILQTKTPTKTKSSIPMLDDAFGSVCVPNSVDPCVFQNPCSAFF
jgi:hypothetical protein